MLSPERGLAVNWGEKMSKGRELAPGVHAVGAIDWDRKYFDQIIPLPGGTSYNSYLIKGSEKVALIDTVDPTKTEELFLNLELAGCEKIDYIISNHAEQDHTGSIPAVLEKYPDAMIVCNEMDKKFIIDELHIPDEKFIVIKDGEEMSLGDKTLQFIFTPWVHWPETMSTLLVEEGILFSCDFFGAHLATSDLYAKTNAETYDAAKRYYAEIMMPFANIIKKNIEKVKAVNPKVIAPSHGAVYDEPEFIISAYEDWISENTKPEVVIAYVSMHGSTAELVAHLEGHFIRGGLSVQQVNLLNVDIGELAMSLVDATTLIVASPTFLGGLHPLAAGSVHLINTLKPKLRLVGYMGSMEWGSHANDEFDLLTKNLHGERLEPFIIKGKANDEDFANLEAYAQHILKKNEEYKIAQ